MAASKSKKLSNIFVWIILGLLVIGLTGFGVTSFSGSASLVGSVGSERITANDYARALQRELSAQTAQTGQPVNLATLRQQGVDRAVLEGLVARAALAHETQRMGVSVGDDEVARQIRETSGFQGTDGSFDRASYEFALDQAGLTTAEFEENVREDVARSVLQLAVVGGVSAPDLFAEAITAYQTETRDFSLVRISEDDLPTPLDGPTEADLEAEYEENAEAFTLPEAREITYAWITPTMIMDDVDVSEDALRGLYDERIDQFVQPERRLLERIVYPDLAAAEAARTELDAGNATFDDLVAARGLTLDDVDLGETAREDLSDAAADAIFGTDNTDVIGPVDSVLGPALFRVNAILDATELVFEEAKEDLRAELAAEAARREIDDLRDQIDDLLAGGATLEDLGNATAMQVETIVWRNGMDQGIAGYDAFRQAAAAAEQGDFPQLEELSDGGLFAVRLDAIVPASLPPLEEVRDDVAASWRTGALRDALASRAQQLAAQLANGAALETLGPEVIEEVQIRRQDFIPDLPQTLVPQIFQLEAEGGIAVVPGSDAAVVARLDSINPGQRGTPGTDALLQLVEVQAAQSIAQDVFEAFGQALQADAGIELNPSVINAVHANFP